MVCALATPTPPSEIWWCFLRARIAQVGAALPRSARGTVQFEVERADDVPSCFFLELCGTKTYGASGWAAAPKTLVSTTEDELFALLYDADPPKRGLRVFGDAALLETLLDTIARVPAPRTW